MMIDSSIIVTENISQYREKGYSLKRACATGTTEMITPMLSSSLTTIAVFVPLVFLSGIAGAIFMDQAFSITVGLLISYVTGIFLLPVLYLLFSCGAIFFGLASVADGGAGYLYGLWGLGIALEGLGLRVGSKHHAAC